ncbi:hypothetical protein HY085_00235 [Candidatus Gottesmanbacteria bacterium]|nr:hypothetical protein [Candidatus Gottesmanbacteria bacterium]
MIPFEIKKELLSLEDEHKAIGIRIKELTRRIEELENPSFEIPRIVSPDQPTFPKFFELLEQKVK